MSVNNIVRRIKTTAPSFSKFITICELRLLFFLYYSKINPSSVVSYDSSTTDQFIVLGLEPNLVLTYTLQVISEVSGNFLNNMNN